MDEKTERHPEVGIMASECLLKRVIHVLKKRTCVFEKRPCVSIKTHLCFHQNALVFEVKRTCVSGKT